MYFMPYCVNFPIFVLDFVSFRMVSCLFSHKSQLRNNTENCETLHIGGNDSNDGDVYIVK